MIVEKKIILEKEDYDCLHDVVLDAINKDMCNHELQQVWKRLPEDIKLDAEKWGTNDTVVRDSIYVWVEKNMK